MRIHPRTSAFLAGFLTATLAAAIFAIWRDGSWKREWVWPDLPGRRSEPVLVVVVGNLQGVAQVRAAIDPARIVAESSDAFALKERRVIAEGLEGVGAILTAAGWTDEPLEIVAFRLPAAREGESRARELVELMNKPTLNLMEARRALALF